MPVLWHTTRLAVSLDMLVFGFGMVTQVLVLAIQNGVDRRDPGTATASPNLFRGAGGAVGVAVFGTAFADRLGYWLPRSVPPHPLGHLNPAVLQASPATVRSLPPAVRLSGVCTPRRSRRR